MSGYSIKVKHPEYMLVGSDFSQQEPKLCAFASQDKSMIRSFQEGKDIYAFIASLAFGKKYEECMEFNEVTGEYQPDGKARRNEAKTIVLGILYGRSVPSIGEQLYGHEDYSDEEKTKKAQYVYDSVLKAFPGLKNFMVQAQLFAKNHGYTETILGRRRHLPDMTLDEFVFEPLPGYVNPDIDPLDLSSLNTAEEGIPAKKIKELKKEFSSYKYFGQIARRTKELYEKEHIKVTNNRQKINDSKRQCVNCVDKETEILTLHGWKKYDEVHEGDEILSYDMEGDKLVKDKIKEVHISKAENDEDLFEVYHIYTSRFDSVCTVDHRWVMENFDTKEIKFYPTEHLLKVHRPRYHILRVVDHNYNDSLSASLTSDLDLDTYWDSIFSNSVSYHSIFNLSKEDALKLYEKGTTVAKNGSIEFRIEESADKFQILCYMAGKAVNKREERIKHRNQDPYNVWKVTCSKRNLNRTARIDMMKKDEEKINLIWCVTTETGTWIARRDGKIYITGNSIIQGSAADFTKMALLNLANDPEWKELGGQVLTVVHDEILAQVPAENYKRGSEVLKHDMEDSGSFLPFPITCDATISYRWYGLDAPCAYVKPDSIDTEDKDEISWIQYHLDEIGYELPIFKDKDGNKPIGDAAQGISGKRSLQMDKFIDDYCNRYHISKDEFIDHIEEKVTKGI